MNNARVLLILLREVIIRRYRRIPITVLRLPLILWCVAVVTYDNFIPYEDLPTSTNPIAQIGRGLLQAQCALHNNIPWAYSLPIPNPINNAVEDFWNGVCERPESPDNARPAFANGCPIDYSINWSVFSQPQDQQVSGSIIRQGVTAAWWAPGVTPPQNGSGTIIVQFCNGATQAVGTGQDGFGALPPRTLNITPVGTEQLPCSCAPVPPPPITAELPPDVTINLPGSGPITFPISFPGVTLDVNGDIIGFDPIIITPIGRFSFDLGGLSFAPRFNLNPNITVPIGGGAGQGGASSGEVQQIVDQSQQTIINDLTQEIQAAECDLSPILDAINALEFQVDVEEAVSLIRCYLEGGQGEVATEVIAASTEGGRFPLPVGTFAVLVEVIPPVRSFSRTQEGGGDSSTVVFWGWHSLNYVDGADGVRLPLNYLQQSIGVPRDAVSITVSAHQLNRARVTAFSRPEVCPTPVSLPLPVEQIQTMTLQALSDRGGSNVVGADSPGGNEDDIALT